MELSGEAERVAHRLARGTTVDVQGRRAEVFEFPVVPFGAPPQASEPNANAGGPWAPAQLTMAVRTDLSTPVSRRLSYFSSGGTATNQSLFRRSLDARPILPRGSSQREKGRNSNANFSMGSRRCVGAAYEDLATLEDGPAWDAGPVSALCQTKLSEQFRTNFMTFVITVGTCCIQ